MLTGRAVMVYLIIGVIAIVAQIVIWLFTTPIGLFVLGLFVFSILGLALFLFMDAKELKTRNDSVAINEEYQITTDQRTDELTYDYIHRASAHLKKADKLKTPRGKYRRITQANDIIVQGLEDPFVNHSLLRNFHERHIKHHLEQEGR